MKIHEYQGKELLQKFNVPVPPGGVAETPTEARQVAETLEKGPFVVKAQIHAGGRGKGGGIKPAATPVEVEEVAAQIIGMTLVTPQTGPEGRLPRTSSGNITWVSCWTGAWPGRSSW
jgi:succinyl-CoA synthetase beta subunit